MPSNIEQAVSLVLNSHQAPQVSTVLSAYLRIAGFPLATPDAVTLFERALDKHPHMEERPGTVTKAITDVRQDYWMKALDLGSNKMIPGVVVDGFYKCPCCGRKMSEDEMKRKVLALQDGLEMERCLGTAPEKPKKTKSKRRIAAKTKARRTRKARLFDPYGPSTSASSM